VKPAAFTYHRAGSADEAVDLLATVGRGAKVLAGGQSLVPVMNMRLAAPAHLVDINRAVDLAFVRVEDTAAGRGVRVGATARHTDLERDEAVFEVLPLLRQAVEHVAHPTIRNRGTTVGSLVHADPAGEMTGVLALLGGTVDLRSADATRTVGAEEFFLAPLECCIEAGELATSAFFPAPQGRTGSAWTEVARRHGDYALCGVGALVSLDDDLRVTRARASYISVSSTPLVLDFTDAVAARSVDTVDWAAAGSLAAGRVDPQEDIHATADYRRHLAEVLTVRALRMAASRAADREETG
jgi:CO/xanthine dehydrogenase FAD-binding subunit